jgi:hypothetical protein
VAVVVQGFRFALAPNPTQDSDLRSHCGAQRFAFNWGLALVRAVLDQRTAEASYGIPDAGLTPSVGWSAYSLRKAWNQAKNQVAPWWAENSKEAYASGLANLATALGNWNASRNGTRRGPKVRFPRFKGKRAAWSCRFTTGAFGLASDRRHVKLPRIGLVRTHTVRGHKHRPAGDVGFQMRAEGWPLLAEQHVVVTADRVGRAYVVRGCVPGPASAPAGRRGRVWPVCRSRTRPRIRKRRQGHRVRRRCATVFREGTCQASGGPDSSARPRSQSPAARSPTLVHE